MVARITERIMERMEHMDLKRVNIMECPEWACVGVLWQRDSVTRNVGDVGAKSERNMVHDMWCALELFYFNFIYLFIYWVL